MLELYLGGARSGKTRLALNQAEQQALAHKKHLIYLATAQAGDDEMRARIEYHQRERAQQSVSWQTIEEPLALAETLSGLDQPQHCIVVDCLTLWLSNHLTESHEQSWLLAKTDLLTSIEQLRCHVIFVSNEVGQGIIPANALSRRFVDESGFLHQQLANVCDRVVFTIAGLAQILKGKPLQEDIVVSTSSCGEPK